MKYYVAYGMNTNLEQMRSRCPKSIALGKVILPNHTLAFKGCCDIVPTQGQDMECALWLITDECERSLDQLEGYPFSYDKKEVLVEYDGQKIWAMVYHMHEGSELASPSRYYLNLVLDGYEDFNMDLEQVITALNETLETEDHVYYSWN